MRIIVGAVLSVVGLVVALMVITNMWETVSASELVVIQAPFSGKLAWTKQQGVAWQGGGTVSSYARRRTFPFEISVRFNDGGHGTMQGSVQWEMPLDDKNLTALHQQFGSSDAIERQLIATVVSKSVNLLG